MLLSRNLDDQRFEDIVREAVGRLPWLCSAWTDHNAHDPGEPVIVTRGVDFDDKFIAEAKNDIMSVVASGDLEEIGLAESAARISKSLAKKIMRQYNRKPQIIVVTEE